MTIQLEIVQRPNFTYIIAKDGRWEQTLFKIRPSGLQRIELDPTNPVSQQMTLDGQNMPIIVNPPFNIGRAQHRVTRVWDQNRSSDERNFQSLLVAGHAIKAGFRTTTGRLRPILLKYDPENKWWSRYSLTDGPTDTLLSPRRMPWRLNKYGQIAIQA